MNVETKQFIIDKPDAITVEYIENYITQSGYTPLRWGIVKIENDKIIIDSVVINLNYQLT